MQSQRNSRSVPFDYLIDAYNTQSPNSQQDSSAQENAKINGIATVFVDGTGRIRNSSDELLRHLSQDFDLSRLDRVHHALWWAGRPIAARPLHRQLSMGREILTIEQLDLHLLWLQDRIFIKPFSGSLFSRLFWVQKICTDPIIYENVKGFLLSYIWLVRYESDFHIARDKHLLPSALTWSQWQLFVQSVLSHIDPNALEGVNRRFEFGELRLNRLNQIYRFLPMFGGQNLLQGYAMGHKTYGTFFKQNFGWIILVVALITTVLSAFQVGLATKQLAALTTMQKASQYFSLFCIVGPFVLTALVGLLFALLFTFHLLVTLRFNARMYRKRMSWKREKREKV